MLHNRSGGCIRKRTMLAAAMGLTTLAAAAIQGSRRFAVVEDSMRPTLEPGDWVIARRHRGVPRRGAVVVFASPHNPQLLLIKRVIGLPGERITVANGQVHIDGSTLAETWASARTAPDSDNLVPDDAVWVLGDDRALSSADSRTIGPVPVDGVAWRVFAIYWPAGRAAAL